MACKSEGIEENDEESSSPMSREETESKFQGRVSTSSESTKMYSANESNVATEKVLGVNWDPIKDHLCFSAKLNVFSNRKRGVQKDNPNYDSKLT